jgi:H+-translocating NAD(P) transhydrogenase subunit alpha
VSLLGPLAMGSSLDGLFIFVLATFVGFEVIRRVPTLLHTPLMSAGNAICGIILVGAILVGAFARGDIEFGLAILAIALATVNVVGGFVVTDRMLKMFKPRQVDKKDGEGPR